MPLGRLIGYYCLLMLLCGLVFTRWLPQEACEPAGVEISLPAPPQFAKHAPMLVSLRPASALALADGSSR